MALSFVSRGGSTNKAKDAAASNHPATMAAAVVTRQRGSSRNLIMPSVPLSGHATTLVARRALISLTIDSVSRRVRMEITRAGSQPSAKGPAEWFTGTVRIDPLFQAVAPGRAGGAAVTFEPGARTAWHSHPLGQRLIVIAGAGRVQRWGGAIEEIRPGDVVSI